MIARSVSVSVISSAAFAILLCGYNPPLSAQELFVYPNRGQSTDQQERDKFSCYQWAAKQTGYDPARNQTTPSGQSAASPKGGALRGAAGGAALGAVGGAIGGNAGKGAAIGAGTGALIGGFRRRQAQKQTAASQAQQAAAADARRGAYNRAFGACLEGRGYTVK